MFLKVEERFACVLDAKAPNQNITSSENIEQVYSYAAHAEIRSTYFALCNGLEFVVYRREESKAILHFTIEDIEHNWDRLVSLLAPNAFQFGKSISYEKIDTSTQVFDYTKRPLLEEIPVKKQAAKRHFGCNAYFTRQSWNVVADLHQAF